MAMAGADANEPGAVALAALEANFNTLLIQIGSVFHGVSGNGQTFDNRHLAQSSMHMKTHVPKALERFHDNLDELENELVRAQMVIRRDLLLSRIKPLLSSAAAVALPSTDLDMPDASDINNTKGEANNNGPDADTKPADNALASIPADEQAKAPLPADVDDDDLDAMFNDLTNPDASADNKPGGDTRPEQQPETNTATTDNGASQQPAQAVSSEANNANTADDDADVSSLLPGLESYANDDNGMPDFPSADFGAGGQNGQGGDPQAFGGDFNFEDLINQDFGTGMDHANDEVDYNQFDDDFFKL